jgi:hypothetical protein
VLFQLVGMPRTAVALQVIGRGDGHAIRRSDAPREQIAVRQLADAKGDVDPFLDQVDEAIVELQVHAQQRMSPHETHLTAASPASARS